ARLAKYRQIRSRLAKDRLAKDRQVRARLVKDRQVKARLNRVRLAKDLQVKAHLNRARLAKDRQAKAHLNTACLVKPHLFKPLLSTDKTSTNEPNTTGSNDYMNEARTEVKIVTTPTPTKVVSKNPTNTEANITTALHDLSRNITAIEAFDAWIAAVERLAKKGTVDMNAKIRNGTVTVDIKFTLSSSTESKTTKTLDSASPASASPASASPASASPATASPASANLTSANLTSACLSEAASKNTEANITMSTRDVSGNIMSIKDLKVWAANVEQQVQNGTVRLIVMFGQGNATMGINTSPSSTESKTAKTPASVSPASASPASTSLSEAARKNLANPEVNITATHDVSRNIMPIDEVSKGLTAAVEDLVMKGAACVIVMIGNGTATMDVNFGKDIPSTDAKTTVGTKGEHSQAPSPAPAEDYMDKKYFSVTKTNEQGVCAPVPQWSSATTYSIRGTYVIYDGRLWSNKWPSRNDTPTHAAVWEEYKQVKG
ncbi:hypothetical protein BGZ72_001142, partial [Mortierella alpina]